MALSAADEGKDTSYTYKQVCQVEGKLQLQDGTLTDLLYKVRAIVKFLTKTYETFLKPPFNVWTFLYQTILRLNVCWSGSRGKVEEPGQRHWVSFLFF